MARSMGCIYIMEAMVGEGDVKVRRSDIKLLADQLVSCSLLKVTEGEKNV